MTLVPDHRSFAAPAAKAARGRGRARDAYPLVKRGFDLGFATLVLLPATLITALVLVVVNPVHNPGPLLYWQKRMGHGCRPFKAVKFRTMTVTGRARRGPDDPVERDRITRLGNWLRRTRFDELPQILNVYRGEMSLIGPRPDCFRHALHFKRVIPEYRHRHAIRPGISGLAQIELGYAEATEATVRKTRADLAYIRHAGFRLDMWIVWQTILTVAGGRGA
jgi:lipopolysaccharide/colanic/teichoic acid biosynthesis glycosyltransferase